jgi:hypothetical protein
VAAANRFVATCGDALQHNSGERWMFRRRYPGVVGSQGIRRRKPAHHLPKVGDDLSPADEARALGQFRWGQFTPAGALERSGFVMRQAVRRSEHPEWRKHNPITVRIGWFLLVMVYGGLAVLVILGILHTMAGFP